MRKKQPRFPVQLATLVQSADETNQELAKMLMESGACHVNWKKDKNSILPKVIVPLLQSGQRGPMEFVARLIKEQKCPLYGQTYNSHFYNARWPESVWWNIVHYAEKFGVPLFTEKKESVVRWWTSTPSWKIVKEAAEYKALNLFFSKSLRLEGKEEQEREHPVALEVLKDLRQVERLGLVGQGYPEIPEFVCELPNITDLDLSKNRLGVLPRNIGNMKKLKCLNLSNNRFRRLSGLGKLENLEVLHLDGNLFRQIPEGIKHIKKLRKVYIGGPYLSSKAIEKGKKMLGNQVDIRVIRKPS